MIRKKKIFLLLALSFLTLATHAHSQDRATLSFATASGRLGSVDNKACVKLKTPVALGGGVYIVHYDPAVLKVRSVKKSSGANFKQVKHFIDERKGSVLVTFLEVEGDAKIFNDEEIFEIRFDVAADAHIGSTPLRFGNCVLANGDGDLMRNTRSDGNFDVKR